jgi:flagellar biosynthesis/type III secretory pathway chaperone
MHTLPAGSTALVETLAEILTQEQQALESFLGLLRHEQDAIRRLSSSGMADVTAHKLNLLETVRVLEQKRSEVVARLTDEWGVGEGELTLRAIADRVGAPEAGALLRQQEQLNKTILEVREASEFNGTLIDDSLDCFQRLLSACRIPEQPLLYSATGSLQTALASEQAFVGRRG